MGYQETPLITKPCISHYNEGYSVLLDMITFTIEMINLSQSIAPYKEIYLPTSSRYKIHILWVSLYHKRIRKNEQFLWSLLPNQGCKSNMLFSGYNVIIPKGPHTPYFSDHVQIKVFFICDQDVWPQYQLQEKICNGVFKIIKISST